MRHRYVEFRATEREDLKYLWAAYKKGAFGDLHEIFLEDMTSNEFKDALTALVMESGLTLWTLIGDTKEGIIPTGLVTGWVIGRQITMSKAVHFPWTSKRNRWETMVNFFDGLRKIAIDQSRNPDDPLRYPVILEFAHFEDKKFWERMADKGIMRKVGHVYDLDEKPSVLFQTKSPVRV